MANQSESKIKPEEALKILEQATSNLKLSRREHAIIIDSLEALRQLLPKQEKSS